MKKIIPLLCFLFLVYGCEYISWDYYFGDKEAEEEPLNIVWYHNDSWLEKGNYISYLADVNDNIAWIDEDIQNSFKLEFTFQVHSNNNTEQYNIDFIIFGGRGISGDFWNEGLVINYKQVVDGQNVSWIRKDGIYGSVNLNEEIITASFPRSEELHCEVEFENSRLIFKINGVIIQNFIINDPDIDIDGFIGFANYWGYTENFTVHVINFETDVL